MNDLIGKLKNNEKWTISVQLLVLYVVAVGIFLAAYEVCAKVLGSQKDKVNAGSMPLSLVTFVVPAAVNAAAVALLVFLAKTTGTQPRVAMVLVPLFLSLEKHVRAIRETPAERRYQLFSAAGVIAGMLGGVALLMKGAPIK